MSVFRITLTTRNPHTREPHFANFECGAATIEDLTTDLNTGRLVGGQMLVTRKSDRHGVFEVTERRPMSIGRAGVAHIEPPTARFIEIGEFADGQH